MLGLRSEVSVTGRLPRPDLLFEMSDLSDARLLGLPQDDASVIAPQNTYGGTDWSVTNLAQAVLTPVGETLVRLMELDSVPAAELDDVLAGLRGD